MKGKGMILCFRACLGLLKVEELPANIKDRITVEVFDEIMDKKEHFEELFKLAKAILRQKKSILK